MLKKLSPKEELEFLKEIYGDDIPMLFSLLRDAFTLLQTRAQMLLGLATICLTITGFSGPRMAASSPWSRFFIGFGLAFVLASVVAIVVGPMRLRWITASRGSTTDETILDNIRRRNFKTKCYQLGTVLLLVGLSGYLLSLIFYLMSVE